MSRDLFSVGQRVLVTSCDKRTQLPGFVAAPKRFRTVRFTGGNLAELLTYLVQVDGLPSHTPSGLWSVEEWQIEPIDDGREVVSWSECAWQPEPVRA